MTELTLLERIVESSPTAVVILLGGLWFLWRALREEIQENRKIAMLAAQSAAQNSEAIHALTLAVDRLRERFERG